MQSGGFREDLYYRLNVFTIPIPPLRERRDDIPLLVAHFVRNSAIVPKRNVTIAPDAMDVLVRYPWPGNARELANVVERALILCESDRLVSENLPIGIRRSSPETTHVNGGQRPTLEEAERRYILQVLDECGGHRQKAATILGISERNLYRKLKQFGVSGQREPAHA
jgi:two-component system response regulator HydG